MARNAKIEFLNHSKIGKIKCVYITHGSDYSDNETRIILKINYNEKQFEKFISKLDFEYDAGYGGQELFGTIWYEDGTWSSRGEYDGSEWWEYNSCPEINKNCLK